MNRRRRVIAGRDQRASAFGAVLMRLCDAVGAVGAALVDGEGETVDYAGALDPFDIKVAAAEWVVVLALLRTSKVSAWPATEQVLVRGARKSYLVEALEDGYSIVLQLLPHAFGASRRGLAEAIRDLCREAGLELPRSIRGDRDRWWRIDVRCTAADARRPVALWLGGTWAGLEILGRLRAEAHEIGYRARLPNGAEITLVREPLGRWYVDTSIGG